MRNQFKSIYIFIIYLCFEHLASQHNKTNYCFQIIKGHIMIIGLCTALSNLQTNLAAQHNRTRETLKRQPEVSRMIISTR